MPIKSQNKSQNKSRKNKSQKRKNSRSRTIKSMPKRYKYRVKGGCENGTCLSSNSQPWISKGGSYLELLNKDIYNHTTDDIFYSVN